MIVERPHYYAKSGRAEEALAIRRRASLVRIATGLPAGRIRTKLGGDGPDVTWECAFAGEREHAADLAARANSPEFDAVRKEIDRKSTRLNSSHIPLSRMPSSA